VAADHDRTTIEKATRNESLTVVEVRVDRSLLAVVLTLLQVPAVKLSLFSPLLNAFSIFYLFSQP
jgi:hypothetical protein